MLVEDKNMIRYLVWSSDKKEILESNKISCGNIICGRKSCKNCIFEINSVDLSEFKFIDIFNEPSYNSIINTNSK